MEKFYVEVEINEIFPLKILKSVINTTKNKLMAKFGKGHTLNIKEVKEKMVVIESECADDFFMLGIGIGIVANAFMEKQYGDGLVEQIEKEREELENDNLI